MAEFALAAFMAVLPDDDPVTDEVRAGQHC